LGLELGSLKQQTVMAQWKLAPACTFLLSEPLWQGSRPCSGFCQCFALVTWAAFSPLPTSYWEKLGARRGAPVWEPSSLLHWHQALCGF